METGERPPFFDNNYLEVSKLVISVASASIGVIALFFFRTDPSDQGLQRHIGFFVFSVVYWVSFIGLLVWRYETYCHRPNSYTRPWYVLMELGVVAQTIPALVGATQRTLAQHG